MSQQILRFSVIAVLAAAMWAPAEARYRYGSYTRGEQQGVYVQLEAGLFNPRNTDAVLATIETIQDFGGGVNSLTPALPEWGNEFAGRVVLGYGWASGNRISFGVWGFNGKQSAAGDGPASGLLHFAVGPPIATGGDFVGDNASPGYFNLTTEIDAVTADLAWSRSQELADSFSLEWSLGLRYANYEETTDGIYDEESTASPSFGTLVYNASKSNEGEMFGVRAAIRGTYKLGRRYSLNAGLGFSFLDGELNASSGLVPGGLLASTTPSSLSVVGDTGRSAHMRDLDLTVAWHSTADSFRVYLGWEQSRWDGIAADLVRNFPGTSAPLRERDSVTFSGYKLGLYFRF